MDEQMLKEARAYFGADLYATQQTGIEIVEAAPGYAKCRLTLGPQHKNAMGAVMGGVLFTMADYAFAVASNFRQNPTVTQTSQIAFLSPVKGEVLYAEAERVRGGRRTCFYRVVITDETGTQNAYVTTSGFVCQ